MAIKILNILIVLFVPFLMLGVIKKTKAFWGGRYGASVFQPLYDFIKLMKKDFVISKTTSGKREKSSAAAVARRCPGRGDSAKSRRAGRTDAAGDREALGRRSRARPRGR